MGETALILNILAFLLCSMASMSLRHVYLWKLCVNLLMVSKMGSQMTFLDFDGTFS